MIHGPIPLAGLVLCGGRSRRMGIDKGTIAIGGRPLVVHAAELLASVADPIILAPGRAGRLGDLGYAEVDDEMEGAGPVAGLAAGLAASPHPLLAVVAVDMPFLSPAVIRMLAASHRGEDAIVPRTERGLEPLHAVYARSALPGVREAMAGGRLALHDMLESLSVREVRQAEWKTVEPTGRFAVNLNRPEDLSTLG